MSERIGFVGLGQMGQPMALNLLHTGYKLRVFDLREERPDVAEDARLSIFFSGDLDAKARVLPLLDALGLHLYDLGERVEVANAVKLGYNFLIAAAIEAMGEAAALVEHCGADRAQFLRMLVESPLFTGAVYEGYGHMIGEREYSDARFPVPMGLKDVELVLQAADRLDVPLPYAEIVHEHLLAARVAGRAHEDWSVLADFVTQERAGSRIVTGLAACSL